MLQKMKVSVIIPCYNQAAFIPKAIASLQTQTFGEWECIVVDDGSTDNTAEVVSNISLREPRVRLLQKANGGSASARDMGLQQAQGEYIQFLDADDIIAPEKLESQIERMEREGADISYTAFCSENRQGERTKLRAVQLGHGRLLRRPRRRIHQHGEQLLQERPFLLQSACRFREDWGWHMKCFDVHPTVSALLDYCGAIYKQNENGKTGSYIRMQEGNFTFMAHMTKQLKGWNTIRWAFRISEELWIWLLRMLKYRSTQIAKTIVILPVVWTIGSFLLMPISFWWILIYFIKTYIAK